MYFHPAETNLIKMLTLTNTGFRFILPKIPFPINSALIRMCMKTYRAEH